MPQTSASDQRRLERSELRLNHLESKAPPHGHILCLLSQVAALDYFFVLWFLTVGRTWKREGYKNLEMADVGAEFLCDF